MSGSRLSKYGKEEITPRGIAMSFCSNVKAEFARHPISRPCCAVAEAYGVLLFCNTCSVAAIKIVTESHDFAQRLPKLFKKAFDVEFDIIPEQEQGKQVFAIEQVGKILHIYCNKIARKSQ